MSEVENKIIEMHKERWLGDSEINAEWLARARESFQFYTGIQQWDEDALDTLTIEGRPALTLNLVFPIVNMLAGYQSQNRHDMKLYPRRGGSVAIAALGTELIKHTLESCQGLHELTDDFIDGCICGKGWASIDRVYEDDIIGGDLVLAKESPFSILEDQLNKSYQLNKGTHVFKTFWWSKQHIELMYPGKAKDLAGATEDPQWEDDKYDLHVHAGSNNDYDRGSGSDVSGYRTKRQYRCKEAWHKVYKKSVYVIDLATFNKVRLTKRQQIEEAQQHIKALNGQYAIQERIAPVLYKDVICGDMLLEHVEDPLNGLTMFPFFRFCPYWVDGYIMGVIDNLKQPQRRHNKAESQNLAHINIMTNAYWRKKKGAKPITQAVLDDFKENVNTPGYIIDEDKIGGEMVREHADGPNIAQVTMADRSAQAIKDISGVNSSLVEQGQEGKESGKAKILRQQAGLIVSQIVFDNFSRTETDVGSFTWEVIRNTDVYSDEEIGFIVQENQLKHFIGRDGQLDLSPMRTMALGRYGVKVGQSSNLPTVRMAHFEEMVDLLKAGVPIPPHLLLELSDLPNKDEVIEYLKRVSQFPVQGQQRALPAQAAAVA